MSDDRYDDQLDEQQGSEEEDPAALFAGTKKVAVNAPVAISPVTPAGNGPQTQTNFDDEANSEELLQVQDNLGVSDEEFSESEAYTSGAQEIIKPESQSEVAQSAQDDDGMSLFRSFLEDGDGQSPGAQQQFAQSEETAGEYAQPGYAEGAESGYSAQEYAEGEYAQPGYAEGAESGYSAQEYAEGEYAQPGYAEGAESGYSEAGYAEGEYAQPGYEEGAEGEYSEAGYAEGEYAQPGYEEGAESGYSDPAGAEQEPDYSQPIAPTSEYETSRQFEPGESGEFAAFVLEEQAKLMASDSTEVEPVESTAGTQAVSGLQQALSGAQQALSGRQQALSGAQQAQQALSGSQQVTSKSSEPNIPLVQLSGVYPELTEEQLASPIEVASIVGETLCDDYRVLGEHGEGDLTQVYVGREINSGRLVAIKRLKVPTPKAIERFSIAIQNLGKLHHPNIVQSIAYLESPSGEPFYVMECVEDGVSLEELLQDAGMIEEEEVIASILIQIADAVDFAHKASIIHGGLKPSNIMVMQGDEDLIVKILDFGMERLRVANRALATSYFAPEQVTQGTLSSKSDIYSLGVLAYHMLTGRLPYDGSIDTIAELKQGQKPEDWQPLWAVRSELACVQELSQLLDEAMEVDPQWRMSSMAEFKQGVTNWFESVQELDFEDEDSGSEELSAVSAIPVIAAASVSPTAPVSPTSYESGDPSGGRDWSTSTLEIPIEEDPLEMFGQNRLSEDPESASANEAIAWLNQEEKSFQADALADDEFQTAEMADEEARMRIDQPPGAPNLDQVFSKSGHDASSQTPYMTPRSDSGQQPVIPPGIPMPPSPPPKQRSPEPEKSVTQRQLEHLQNMIEAEAAEAAEAGEVEGEAAPVKKKKRKRLSKRRGQNVRSTITKLVALKHTEFSQGQTMTVQFTEKFAGKGTRLSPQQTIIRLVATAVVSITLIALCITNLEGLKGFWVTASHTLSNLVLKKKISEEELAAQEQERKALEAAAKAQAQRPLVPTAARPEVSNAPGQYSQHQKNVKGEYNSLSKGPIADKEKMTPQKGWEKRTYRKGEIVYPYYNFEEQPIVQQGNNLTGQRVIRKGDSEIKEISQQNK